MAARVLLPALYVAAAVLALMAGAAAEGTQLNLCAWGEQHADPCLPGGKWDPLLASCQGSMSGQSCFQCYSGPNCDTLAPFSSSMNSSCTVVIAGGNPVLFQEYWEQQANDGCTSTPTSYRTSYQNMGDIPPISPVEDAIVALHNVIGNADPSGHHVVLGFGSTQVMAAALFAKATLIARAHAGSTMNVLVEAPYYMHYSYQVNNTVIATADGGTARGAVWAPDASLADPTTVAIVTRPNNPNGELRTTAAEYDDRAIYDMAYLWPHFTAEYDQRLNHSLMIFTASKMAGIAGGRFGWALVKNAETAALMREYVSAQTLGLDISSQLRMVNVLRTLAVQGLDSSGMLAFAVSSMQQRWAQIQSIFNTTAAAAAGFELQNMCTDGGLRCGAYAWVKVPTGYSGPALFAKAKIVGESGLIFGSDDNHIRFELIGRSVELKMAFARMRAVVEMMASPTTRLPLTRDIAMRTTLRQHLASPEGQLAAQSRGC